ncbi:hypothetical protein Tco_1270721 [Tanacetum coccineum]
MENLYLKHGFISRTYSKKSLIMASIFGFKSKSFMTMSIPSQDEPLTNQSVLERPKGFRYTGQGNRIASICAEYIQPSSNRARNSSPTLDGSSSCSDTTYPSEQNHYLMRKSAVVPMTLRLAWKTPNKPSLNMRLRVPIKREDARLSRFEADFKQQQKEMTNKIDTELKAITNQIAGTLPSDTVRKLNSILESLGLVPRSSNMKFVCSKEDDREGMFIEIIRDDDEPRDEGERAPTEEPIVEYFDTFPTSDELTYHRYLMSGPIPSIFLRTPIIMEGCPYNLKIPCNIGHVHIEKAYTDLNSPLNIMTRMMYNWIMRRKLDHRDDANGGICNFTGRIKGMHVFIENFTYVIDFMIVKDISSIIDPRLPQVVLGKPFIEISNMTHDPHEGAVRFIKGTDEVAYKMLHKIE